MRKVKRDIAVSLLNALHECRLGEIEDGESDDFNDLPFARATLAGLYISKAMVDLGFTTAARVYSETGNLEMALEAL